MSHEVLTVGSEKPLNKWTTEYEYGMNLDDLGALLFRGEDFNDRANFFKIQDALFKRVLSGVATEGEVKIAVNCAVVYGENFDLRADHFDLVPKSWYTNNRIAEALASTSEENRRWVEHVTKRTF